MSSAEGGLSLNTRPLIVYGTAKIVNEGDSSQNARNVTLLNILSYIYMKREGRAIYFACLL